MNLIGRNLLTPDEILRFENPHTYYVDLSQELWNLKQELLMEKDH